MKPKKLIIRRKYDQLKEINSDLSKTFFMNQQKLTKKWM